MRLTLTDTERLLLANQYELLAAVRKDDHYALVAETLRNGHKWLYEQSFDSLSENLPEEKAEHVLQILGIYGDIHDSYAHLTDKTGIDERPLVFPGFDGNNETELLSFAQALRKHDRFSSTIGASAKNSHMPTTDTYRRMIQRWAELGKPMHPYTRDDPRNSGRANSSQPAQVVSPKSAGAAER